MNADEISARLGEYLAKEILKQPGRAIPADEPLLTSGLVDSFHLVDLGLYIEDTFGVRIDDSELNASTFDTLAQLVSLVQSRQ